MTFSGNGSIHPSLAYLSFTHYVLSYSMNITNADVIPSPDAPDVAIIGAGPAGLLTALALRETAKSITVFERDQDLAHDYFERLGYAILGGGVRAFNKIDPRIETALRHAGAVVSDPFYDIRFVEDGIAIPPSKSKETMLTLSRQLFDTSLSSIVRAEPAINMIQATIKDIHLLEEEGQVELIDHTNKVSGPYDLVVDATGRTRAQGTKGPVATALHRMGLTIPTETYEPNMHIQSTVLQLPPSAIPAWNMFLENIRPPYERIGGQLMKLEDNQMQVGIAERILDKKPPVSFVDGISSLQNGVFKDSLVRYESLYKPTSYRFREAYVRRFDLVPKMPESLIVVGDAYMSTSPVYGMGISNAAIAAAHLKHCLAIYGEVTPEFHNYYYSSVWKQLQIGWEVGRTTDMMYYAHGEGTAYAQLTNLLTSRWRWRITQDPHIVRQLIGASNLLPECETPFEVSSVLTALAKSLTHTKPTPKLVAHLLDTIGGDAFKDTNSPER